MGSQGVNTKEGRGQVKTRAEGEKCEEAERQMKRNGIASRLNHLEVLIS